jgi:transposase
LDVEDWAEIRRLHRSDGLWINEIARRTGAARNTVRSALRSDAPPEYRREDRGSAVDAFEPEIRRLLIRRRHAWGNVNRKIPTVEIYEAKLEDPLSRRNCLNDDALRPSP